jgi:hypothetical protein
VADSCEPGNESLGSTKDEEFLDHVRRLLMNKMIYININIPPTWTDIYI